MSGNGTLRWFKSSYSDGGGGQCVEVAVCPRTTAAAIHIRDSKNPAGGIVTVSGEAWAAFLAVPAVPPTP